jgi:nucleotide-binding universal stress UspA family protein
MFERVLVPTDFSKYAAKMLECVGEIPGVKEIILLNIVDASNPAILEEHGWSYDSLIQEAKTHLEEQRKHMDLEGLEPTVRPILKLITRPMSGEDGVNMRWPEPRPDVELIEGGDVAGAIQKTADEEKASLIIMGAKGKGLVNGLLLGSVSTEVLRHGKTNLLLIRHKLLEGINGTSFEKFCPDMFYRVLVATDFSTDAGNTLSFAKSLENIQEVALVHVASRGEKELSKDEAAKRLESLKDEFAAAGRRATAYVLEGNPSNEIVSMAEKIDASLILMSYQGKGMLEHFRVGSTTLNVARKADRPVMVVRPGKPAK